MCKAVKLRSFGDTCYDMANALSNRGVSMTGVEDWRIDLFGRHEALQAKEHVAWRAEGGVVREYGDEM